MGESKAGTCPECEQKVTLDKDGCCPVCGEGVLDLGDGRWVG